MGFYGFYQMSNTGFELPIVLLLASVAFETAKSFPHVVKSGVHMC